MAWTRKKALKDVTLSTISQYVVLALVVLRGFLFSKYLGPEGFGVWVSIYLIFTYGLYSHFGLSNAVSILAPESIGAGKEDEAKRYLSSAITWMNLFGFLFFIFISLAAVFGVSDFLSQNKLPVILIALAVPLTFNFNFSVYRLQYNHNYKKAGLLQAALALTDLILSFYLLMTMGLPGAFVGMLISLLIYTVIITKDGFKNLFVCFEKKAFLGLFKTGSQVIFVSFAFAILTTADKFSVTNLFSKSEMGYFSNAVSLAMLPYTISLALNGITSQRMLEEYGRTKETKSIKLFLDESVFAVAFLIPFFSVLLVAFAEPVISMFLPKYLESLRFVDKLSIGVYFLAICMSCYSYLLVLKKYLLLFVVMLLLLAAVFVGNSFIADSSYGLIGVSYVTVANYFLFAFLLYIIAYREYYRIGRIIWMFFRLSLPVLPIVLAFSMKFYVADSFLKFFIRIAISLLWGAFAYFYLSKKTTILSQLIGMIRNKFF